MGNTCRVRSAVAPGITGLPVVVEAEATSDAEPAFSLAGVEYPREMRDRIRAAVLNSGETWPSQALTVTAGTEELGGAGGSMLDVAVAVAILAAAGSVPVASAAGVALIGELGLDGRLRPVRGVLPAVTAAVAAGARRVVVPVRNTVEAALVPGADVRGAGSLADVLGFLRGTVDLPPAATNRVTDAGAGAFLCIGWLTWRTSRAPGSRRWGFGRSRSPWRAGITCC